MSDQFIKDACDPQRSVVVEACAGSGKTWILISRIFRLLISGISPHQILAITFTRKAAQEMRDRLQKILIEFSEYDDEKIIQELMLRGMTKSEAERAIPKSRALFEEVLSNPQKICIDTFHGWFSQICSVAPLTSDIHTQGVMREDQQRILNDAMQSWWEKLGQGKGEFAPLQTDYLSLLENMSAFAVNQLVIGKTSILFHRALWVQFQKYCQLSNMTVEEVIQSYFPASFQANPLQTLQDEMKLNWQGLETALHCLNQGGAQDKKIAKSIEEIFHLKNNHSSIEDLAPYLEKLVFTNDGFIRKSLQKITNAVSEYLEKNQQLHLEVEILKTFEDWAHDLEVYQAWKFENSIYQIHQKWLRLAKSASEHFFRYKKNNRLMDFNDLEFNAYQLMSDQDTAVYLQARLDARFQHILIDEFQDTNPLQWQILKAWLDAYSDGTSDKPKVFLVGDPKQSIYRFRRADARLFEIAKSYLNNHFNALTINHSETRRNPPEIVELINDVFKKVKDINPDYAFEDHTTLWKNLDQTPVSPKVFRLPLIEVPELPENNPERDPFTEEMPDKSLQKSALQSEIEAEQIGKIIQNWLITESVIDDIEGVKISRKPNLGDFLILVRTKQHLQTIERVFNRLGLPCDSPRKGGLLQSLETEDISALLNTLLLQGNNLTLAHVLRSPIFSCNESDLEVLALKSMGDQSNWWNALVNLEPSSQLPNLLFAAELLKKWSDLAKFLPVHDLLDLIYHEGKVLERYASASPPLIRAKVLGNLEAFLLLALNTNAGRYPSLSRFIEELNILIKGDEQESPDESEIESSDDTDDSESGMVDNRFVRIMTIHAAKGLEAPFVFIMNSNSVKKKKDSCAVLFDWPPKQNLPSGVFLYSSKWITPKVEKLLEEEKKITDKENWNLLYVAMTRAKQNLVVSGLAIKESEANPSPIESTSWYGYLSETGLSEIALDEICSEPITLDGEGIHPIKQFAVHDNSKKIYCPSLPQIASEELSSHLLETVEEIVEDTFSFARDLGTAIHLILERVLDESDQLKNPPVLPNIKVLQNWLKIHPKLLPDAYNAVQNILLQPNLNKYFYPKDFHKAWNELDLVGSDGHQFKVDRLVEFNDSLVIMDYKLSIPPKGSDELIKYERQIKNYAHLINALRPDKIIEGFLIDRFGSTYAIDLSEIN